MAIIKDFATPQGVVARYHKIVKAEILPATASVNITLAIFATPEARDSGAQVLWHEYVSIPFSALTQDPRDLLYPMLAYFGDSYLRGGQPDEEGNGAPGNFEINLKPEAMVPPAPPAPSPAPEPPPPPAPTPEPDPVEPPAPAPGEGQ